MWSNDISPRRTLVRRLAATVAATVVATVAGIAIGVAPASAATVYTVTNTSGDASVSGSLPWALKRANEATAGFDRIRFNIAGAGPHVITVGQTLYVNDQVSIEGTSQPGYNGAPVVYVQGGSNVPSVFLLQSDPARGRTSAGSTIAGLGIYRYTSNAITIMPSSYGNWIQSNYIGFRISGGSVLLNTSSGLANVATSRGIGIASSHNVIRWNTIAGTDNAITVGLAGAPSGPYRGNSIRENRIGTNPEGTSAVGYGNLGDGIFLGEGAIENFLGPDNVLSGNGSAGVELFHSTVQRNVVFRNRIGLDNRGVNKVGNGDLGVLISMGARNNTIGGTFGGNYIAGNYYGGISIGQSAWGAGHGNWVQGNVIGLNVYNQVIPGQQVGVSINSGSTSNLVEGNVIGGHEQHGVIVGDTSNRGTYSNQVSRNDIGRTATGAAAGNGGFAVMFLNSGYNWMMDNRLGVNLLGAIGEVNSPGLVVRL